MLEKSYFWSVGMYLTDRSYGGPEEGGWWYTSGKLITDLDLYTENEIPLPAVFKTMEEAYAHAKLIDVRVDSTINVGRREISSVLSEGKYAAEVFEGAMPSYFPNPKPHYE